MLTMAVDRRKLVLLRRPLPPIKPAHDSTIRQAVGDVPEEAYILERLSPLSGKRPSSRKSEFRSRGGDIVCDSQYTVKEWKPRGPDSFIPSVSPRTYLPNMSLALMLTHDRSSPPTPPLFTLNNFQYLAARTSFQWKRQGGQIAPKAAMISRENYRKLTSWAATQLPSQKELRSQLLEGDPPEIKIGKPRHQVLLEMRAMLNKVLEDIDTDTDESASSSESSQLQLVPVCPSSEAVFKGSRSRYFMGEGRSNSPFDEKADVISPAEAAVLESLLAGGKVLVLKAHFLQSLPHLEPLAATLTDLNLSFNELREFPSQLLLLNQLTVLKMRNNPISEIPSEIRQLQCLKSFCISFNLLTSLPAGLYDLQNLRDVDVSYNRISFLSNDLRKLKSLCVLNVEGNQLSGLPCGILELRDVKQILASNNFMHPLLWAEKSVSQPQRLLDLSALCVTNHGIDQFYSFSLPNDIRCFLNTASTCDCCGGCLFGEGLRVIQSTHEPMFSVRNIPFVFTACSPSCRDKFLPQKPKTIAVKHYI